MKLIGNWYPLGSGVYESKNGFRVHVGGQLVRAPDKTFISVFEPCNHTLFYRFFYIMGRNRKRALMAFAESKFNCKAK